jgi:hypothetical protein
LYRTKREKIPPQKVEKKDILLGGGGDFVDTVLAFKEIVSRDSIFIKVCEVTSMHSCVG